MSHGLMPNEVAEGTRSGLAPLARGLHRAGVTANAVTVLGVLVTIAGSALLASGRPLAALVVLLAGALADTLDGQLAKAAGGGTRFGAFLDSTLDRVSDAALGCGAAALGAALGDPLLFWSALVGLVASFLVSYIRAKAESMGATAAVGLMPREARLMVLLIGVGLWGLFGLYPLFVATFAAVALLSVVTLFQRIAFVARELRTTEGTR
ncbi:MAG TPA: CDP-alcohol phosphatidyltransferase family protein [Candidatus Limnocylindria bacterium]|nr:CDP-alcohol phosphatidyltransferase family protein [Candidatus Limnocylindria bacterium]